jgi:hypothetical protein
MPLSLHAALSRSSGMGGTLGTIALKDSIELFPYSHSTKLAI